MWYARTEEIKGAQRLRLLRDGSALSFAEMFDLMETDAEFRRWYTSVLAGSPFDAFFWEHPPLGTRDRGVAAELVLVDAPALAGLRPDPEPFRSQLEERADADVAMFENLGGDATLIVPRPIASPDVYAHLAAFVRQAPPDQVDHLWERTAHAVRESLGARPRWLSTAGMGVAWLHVRIDSYPKYYRFGPYKAAR